MFEAKVRPVTHEFYDYKSIVMLRLIVFLVCFFFLFWSVRFLIECYFQKPKKCTPFFLFLRLPNGKGKLVLMFKNTFFCLPGEYMVKI